MSRIRIVTLALLAVFLLSACQVRVRQSTLVGDDGSGAVGVVVAADEEFRQAIASFGGDQAENPFEAAAQDLGEGFEWTEYNEEGFLGVQVSREFTTIDEYDAIAEELGGLAGVEFAFPELTSADGRYRFSAEFPEFDEEALAGIGSGTGFDLSALPLDDIFDIQITVKLPGELISNNGDEVDENGQVAWNLGIDSGPLTLEAESEVSGLPWLIAGGGVVALVVVALLIVRVIGRRGPPEVEQSVVVASE